MATGETMVIDVQVVETAKGEPTRPDHLPTSSVWVESISAWVDEDSGEVFEVEAEASIPQDRILTDAEAEAELEQLMWRKQREITAADRLYDAVKAVTKTLEGAARIRSGSFAFRLKSVEPHLLKWAKWKLETTKGAFIPSVKGNGKIGIKTIPFSAKVADRKDDRAAAVAWAKSNMPHLVKSVTTEVLDLSLLTDEDKAKLAASKAEDAECPWEVPCPFEITLPGEELDWKHGLKTKEEIEKAAAKKAKATGGKG
jgi:hypothetical protein